MASLKRNVLANYAGQFYLTIIGIVMVPVYVKHMGAEAYGLVGFFGLMQAWFQLLDVGLTPTLVRETARFRGGAVDATTLRRMVRALEGIFFAVAFVGGGLVVAGAGRIASGWLKVQQLPISEVRNAIMLMGLIACLRWVCELYRGIISGFEHLVWLNGFNSLVATFRFLLVLLVFKWVGTRPIHFFGFQLGVACFEAAGLFFQAYRLLPKVEGRGLHLWDFRPLKSNLNFSLSIAFTGLVWVLVTQTDKLMLSKLLPLGEYAYFTLAVLVASGITVIIGPVSGALLPRLTRLAAERDEEGLVATYRNATQVVAMVALPAALVLAVFPEQVLWAWTGKAEIVHYAAPVLRLYAIGNGFMALAAFPYYLQFAQGDLRLHLLGNVVFVVFLIPSLVWATNKLGAIGAGWVWLWSNLLFFLFWTPIVHRRFLSNLHLDWLLRDIGEIALVGSLMSGLIHQLRFRPSGRFGSLAFVVGGGLLVTIVSGMGSRFVRSMLKKVKVMA